MSKRPETRFYARDRITNLLQSVILMLALVALLSLSGTFLAR